MLENRKTKPVLAVVLFALFFQNALATSTSSISAAAVGTVPSYADLLNASIDRHRTNEKLDEPDEALQLISANSGQTDPYEITAHLKRDFPSIDPGAKIRVLPIMRENLILKGTDYTRLVTSLTPLLKFYGLERKVIP